MIVILCRRQRTSSEPSISLSPLSRRDLEAVGTSLLPQEWSTYGVFDPFKTI
ncbi:hypothetical protein AAZX31_10G016900 [Glycine max]